MTAPANLSSDEYNGESPLSTVTSIIDKALMKELVQVDAWQSSWHIALEWAAIIVTAALAWTYWHPVLYLLAVAFIGARQHALLIMMHDGAHYRLYRNRDINDWVGQIFLAWPFFFVDMLIYRNRHFAHHRYTNRKGDPDWERKQNLEWVYPQTTAAVVKNLVIYLTGVGFFKTMAALRVKMEDEEKPQSNQKTSRMKIGKYIFLLALLASFFIFSSSWWYAFLLFWLVPFFTWAQLCLIIRSISEHFAITKNRQGIFALTRTVTPPLLERMFIASKSVYYHLEHHLFPGVPFYNLARLHKALMANPDYNKGIHRNNSYWEVMFSDCTGKSGEIYNIAHPLNPV